MRRSRAASWLAIGAVAYTAIAALRAPPPTPAGSGLPLAALVVLPVVLLLVWRATEDARSAEGPRSTASAAARATATGCAVVLASLTGAPSPALRVLTNAGAGLAAAASLVALARMEGPGGLVQPPEGARRLDASAVAILLWTVAVAMPLASLAEIAPVERVTVDWATAAAATASMAVSVAASLRARALRRLELGVADRAWAALCASATALVAGAGAASVGVHAPEVVLPIASSIAAALVAASAVAPETRAISRTLRVGLALVVLCVPVALIAVWLSAHVAPSRAGFVAFFACTACGLGGLAAPLLARRLAPEGTQWLDAVDAATRAAMLPEPHEALEAALLALRDAGGPQGKGGRAGVFRIASGDFVFVDRAGYVQHEAASVPAIVVELSEREPEGVLRAEALAAARVRRPDVRPAADWLGERRLLAVATIRDESGPVALLALPRGRRRAPMTLEEARAAAALANRLGAVLGLSERLARSHKRELEAQRSADRLAEDVAALRASIRSSAEQADALASALERPTRTARYSPAARAAEIEIERLASSAAPAVLVTAPGIDALAWAAHLHRLSSRRGGPFVVVDGCAPPQTDPERWRDPSTSPAAAARGGTFVVLDAHVLPEAVQAVLTFALPEDAGIVVTLPSTVDALVGAGRLHEGLADRLGDRAVALPTLAARAEDLRALCLARLSRLGMAARGAPLGLDPRALARLAEHTWPGNDAELESVLVRAALVATGDSVRESDLDAIGFVPVSAPSRSVSERPRAGPIPPARRRRVRS